MLGREAGIFPCLFKTLFLKILQNLRGRGKREEETGDQEIRKPVRAQYGHVEDNTGPQVSLLREGIGLLTELRKLIIQQSESNSKAESNTKGEKSRICINFLGRSESQRLGSGVKRGKITGNNFKKLKDPIGASKLRSITQEMTEKIEEALRVKFTD